MAPHLIERDGILRCSVCQQLFLDLLPEFFFRPVSLNLLSDEFRERLSPERNMNERKIRLQKPVRLPAIEIGSGEKIADWRTANNGCPKRVKFCPFSTRENIGPLCRGIRR